MLSPSDANFESFAGAGRVKPIQIGFPVELTGVWNATTGYPWKRLMLSGVAVANASPLQMTGTNAVPIDGNTALTSGTKGWLEPDPGAVGYLFITGDTSDGGITVEEADGSPSYAGATTLEVDQDTGLKLITGGGGAPQIRIAQKVNPPVDRVMVGNAILGPPVVFSVDDASDTPSDGQSVLLTGQSTPSENGHYVYVSAGGGTLLVEDESSDPPIWTGAGATVSCTGGTKVNTTWVHLGSGSWVCAVGNNWSGAAHVNYIPMYSADSGAENTLARSEIVAEYSDPLYPTCSYSYRINYIGAYNGAVPYTDPGLACREWGVFRDRMEVWQFGYEFGTGSNQRGRYGYDFISLRTDATDTLSLQYSAGYGLQVTMAGATNAKIDAEGGFAVSGTAGLSGALAPGATATGGIITDLGTGAFVGTASSNAFTNTNSFTSPGAGDVPLTVKAAPAQTADLIQVLDSGGLTVLARVEADGEIEAASGAVRLNTVLNDGQLALYNSAGASYATLTAGASNLLTASGGLTTGGALTVSSGGATITAGGLTVSAGGANITGTVTATTFSGSGASLTALPSSQLTGALPAISGASLTSLSASSVASGTLAVDYGGTGRTSHTAYAVLCGGTTSTGAQQSVASVGTSGQVLTSNGAGALPSFQSPSTAIDITGLTAADPADGDEVPVYDVSATANRKVTIQRVLGLCAATPGGRISTANTDAFEINGGSNTIYYLPVYHARLPLWDGTRWLNLSYSDSGLSIALSGLTANRPYDVFCYSSSGSPTLELLAWTSDTARATGISIQEGRYCKTGDKTRLYLGTIYTNATNSVNQSNAEEPLWNMYHRREREVFAIETADSWTYATGTWRQWNNSSTSRVKWIAGLKAEVAKVTALGCMNLPNGAGGAVGIGYDSATANVATGIGQGYCSGTSALDSQTVESSYAIHPAAGSHYFQMLEIARAGTVTFLGDGGTPTTTQSKIKAYIWS